MAVKQVAIRLKPEGGAEIRTEIRQVEEAGVKAADAQAAATEKATAAAERNEAQWRKNAETYRRAAAAAEEQARINASLGVTPTGKSAAESASIFAANDDDVRRANQIRAAVDPLWAAQNRYNEALEETNRLRASGHLKDDAAIARQNQLQKELDETTAALSRNTSGLTRNQMASRLNLTRQGADVAVTAAMGMNPAMIAIQQGPQILDALATSGIRLTPVMLAAGVAVSALAAGVVAVAAGWAKGSSDAAKYELAASGIGRTAGLTGDTLRQLVETHARVGEVSIASARDQAAAYLATGRIGGEVIGRLIDLQRDYAAFVGKDAKEATQDLARAMLDPVKAGEEMTRTFGLLTQAQLDEIEAAVKAGDLMRAQVTLSDALAASVKGQADRVSEATTLWDALSRSISDAATAFGEWAYQTQDERLQQLIDQRAGYERFVAGGGRLTRGQQRVYDEAGQEASAIQARRAAERAADDARSRDAQANQAAQLAEDRRKAAEAEARRNAAAARAADRRAEQEAREQLRRDRREEDRAAELAMAEARAAEDGDRIRALEDEAAVRTRIRALEDDGVAAAEAKTKADAEQARLVAARYETSVRESAELARAASFEVDRIRGLERTVGLEDRRLDLNRRIDAYFKSGLDKAQAAAAAGADLLEIETAQAEVMQRQVALAERAHALNLARLSGRSADERRLDREGRIEGRAREIEGREKLNYGAGMDRATDEIDAEISAQAEGVHREWLHSFVADIRSGGIREALASQFESAADRMIKRLIDQLFDMDWSTILGRGGPGGGGGTGGDWVSAALNFVLGGGGPGKNADGTDFWRGGLSWVGERGPELVNLPRGSQVLSHERSNRLMMRAATGPAASVVNYYSLDGAVTTDELWRRIDQGDARAARAGANMGAARGASMAVSTVQASAPEAQRTDRMLRS